MIVEKWTAVEVKALRTAALRETQEQFAERLGWGPSTIRAWERSAVGRTVRASRAEDLDTVLRRLTPEQAQRFAVALSTSHPGPLVHPGIATGQHEAVTEEDADVRRREFGKVAAVMATLPALGHPAQARIGAEDVQRLAAAVAELIAADQQVGGAPLVEAAVATLDRTLALLDSTAYSDATGRALMSATGNLAVQTGWLAFDADRHSLARRCHADAFALASGSNDEELTAHVCLNAANQAIALARRGSGSPSYAITMIGRARDLMRGRPPGRIHALISVRAAQAHGVARDRHGFGRAITTAWRELDAAREFESVDDCPEWLRFVSPSEVRAHEARGHHDLGDPARAVELYEVTCSEPAQPRNALNDRAWLAATRAVLGDTRGALEEGAAVLATLEESVRSPRTLKALAPVRATGDADFAARFDALVAEGIV
ncbi:hypothetical protein [Nocardia jiangsuensis]|uniref:HTH cro/C1-type domain-containing protein n=1 Tax=Nocardia jiangsuensis TaxID=1691563 RepID=A0ABV8DVR9_9NOCA